jgi:hypothetical protein
MDVKLGLLYRLRVSENRVLRRVYGPKRKEVPGDWRRLHNEELLNLYASLNVIRVIKSRRMRCAEYVARMGEMRSTMFWLENLKGRDYLEISRHRWEDNIRMDLRETGWEVVDWIHLTQDRDGCGLL